MERGIRIEDTTRGRHCESREDVSTRSREDGIFGFSSKLFRSQSLRPRRALPSSFSARIIPPLIRFPGSLTSPLPPFVFPSSSGFFFLYPDSSSSIFRRLLHPHLHLTSLPLWWPTSYTDEAIVPL